MITRIYGHIVVECDACGKSLGTDTKDFEEARAIMKQNGWIARKFGDVWQHRCESCMETVHHQPRFRVGKG